MDKSLAPLLAYLRSLSLAGKHDFAARVGVTLGYLYKAISRAKSRGHKFGAELAIAIERESGGVVRCESLRPDVDWAVLRKSPRRAKRAPSLKAASAVVVASDEVAS